MAQKMKKENAAIKHPDRISSYFKCETGILVIITITGILYNIGMVAGPYFEGKLVQKLCDILNGNSTAESMMRLCLVYIAVIAFVQGMRTLKRFYVRRLANNVNKNMRRMVYNSLVHKEHAKFEADSIGVMMTRAVADVNACAEGMRKFTTEIFDTGVVLIAYFVMLVIYDVRLAFICCIFPPIAYFLAAKLKTVVYRYNKIYKRQNEILNSMTNDRISGAILYRIFGRQEDKNKEYGKTLSAYEKAAVKATIWESAMPPAYLVVSLISFIFIIYFGSKNVSGQGWKIWDIAAFTTFFSCYNKLAVKSSKAAKLFNTVQKANVSWKRVQPLIQDYQELEEDRNNCTVQNICIQNLSFAYPNGEKIISNLNLNAKCGQIIGITGPVAGGKSTFGKVFLNENPYEGSIMLDGLELREMMEKERNGRITYLGHQPELISSSIRENICMGDDLDITKWLSFVCFDEDMKSMEQREDTLIGESGTQLSGGQQARIALARTLSHARSVLILDDPFAALDVITEKKIFSHLRDMSSESIIFIISHRLEIFPEMDQIIWIDNNRITVGCHEELFSSHTEYRRLYQLQREGVCENEA